MTKQKPTRPGTFSHFFEDVGSKGAKITKTVPGLIAPAPLPAPIPVGWPKAQCLNNRFKPAIKIVPGLLANGPNG